MNARDTNIYLSTLMIALHIIYVHDQHIVALDLVKVSTSIEELEKHTKFSPCSIDKEIVTWLKTGKKKC